MINLYHGSPPCIQQEYAHVSKEQKNVVHADAGESAEDVQPPAAIVQQKRATGASLPSLMLATAQAVSLGGFSPSAHHVLDFPSQRYCPRSSTYLRDAAASSDVAFLVGAHNKAWRSSCSRVLLRRGTSQDELASNLRCDC